MVKRLVNFMASKHAWLGQCTWKKQISSLSYARTERHMATYFISTYLQLNGNYYSACRRRGGVLKCPRFWFCFFFGVESWAAAHGLYRCTEYRLLSEPMSTRLLNSISSRICRQNTQFNMYTTTSKQEEGCTFKDSHPKCFITTNFDKFHREAFARGDESR